MRPISSDAVAQDVREALDRAGHQYVQFALRGRAVIVLGPSDRATQRAILALQSTNTLREMRSVGWAFVTIDDYARGTARGAHAAPHAADQRRKG